MKNKYTTPILVALIIPLLAVMSALFVVYMKKSTKPLESSFPYELYLQNPLSCFGNTYDFDAQIDSQLAILDDGVVISLILKEGKMAVFIPLHVSGNIFPKQRYMFSAKVGKTGELVIKKMQKL